MRLEKREWRGESMIGASLKKLKTNHVILIMLVSIIILCRAQMLQGIVS